MVVLAFSTSFSSVSYNSATVIVREALDMNLTDNYHDYWFFITGTSMSNVVWRQIFKKFSREAILLSR